MNADLNPQEFVAHHVDQCEQEIKTGRLEYLSDQAALEFWRSAPIAVGDIVIRRRSPKYRIRVERITGKPVCIIEGRCVETGVSVSGDIECYEPV